MNQDSWNTAPTTPDSRKRRRRRLWTLLIALGTAAVLVVGTWAVTTTRSSAAPTSSPSAVASASSSQSAASTASSGQTDLQSDLASPAQTVLSKTYTSVVNISVSTSAGRRAASGIGSGVIYTSDGYILTNDHVVTLEQQVGHERLEEDALRAHAAGAAAFDGAHASIAVKLAVFAVLTVVCPVVLYHSIERPGIALPVARSAKRIRVQAATRAGNRIRLNAAAIRLGIGIGRVRRIRHLRFSP